MAAGARDRFPPAALRDKRVLLPVAALALAVAVLVILRLRSPEPVLPGAAAQEGEGRAALSDAPVETWTDRFTELQRAGEWAALARELSAIEKARPDLYDRYRLGYLHARAALEAGDTDAASESLAPFLVAGHPFRDLALYHAARLADRKGDRADASRRRLELIAGYPQATHRQQAVEDETVAAEGDPTRLQALLAQVTGSVDVMTLRDIEARLVEAQASTDPAAAAARGVRLLKAVIADDAAERVSLALDRPELRARLAPAERVLVGEAARSHRRFDRAVEILEAARPLLPARRDELVFSIGRARFGAERYEEAEKIYLDGAAGSSDAEQKAVFFFHASRCAQLLGDDARAERHMASAIAVGGKLPKTSAAITQRLRTRLAHDRLADAASDLRLLRQRFPQDHALVEGTLAYATGMVAKAQPREALRELDALPRRLLKKQDAPEIEYWRGRAKEGFDPRAAGHHYLAVLRSEASSHFASFARPRLAEPAVAAAVRKEQAARAAQVEQLLKAGDVEAARGFQTDVVLLAPPAEQAKEAERLAEIYRQVPRYAEVLDLRPPAFPRLPLADPVPASPSPASPAPSSPASSPSPAPSGPDRLDNLLALGLFDDAVDLIRERYPLQPPASAVARAAALSHAGATRASIQSIEIAARAFPPDFLPRLLPPEVKRLLHPRYFQDEIVKGALAHGADPRLVLSIMREESRFEPRARSAASARGLLQLIITTAREVGKALGLVDVESEDLYDPAIAIRLGTRYVADLQKQFAGDPYKTAAGYNAGPNQARLWARLAPGPGSDFFLSAVNFDETKDYVRKVLNSYERYGEIYGGGDDGAGEGPGR